MITIYFYSIAGLESNENINESLENLISLDCFNESDKNIAKHCLACAENGNYPSKEYFNNIYKNEPVTTYNSVAEILTHYKAMVDFYQRQFLQREITRKINETSNTTDLLNGLSKILVDAENSSADEFDFDNEMYEPKFYGDRPDKPLENGMLLGVKGIDDATYGFERGQVASICGFTAHGKSTLINSAVYLNVMNGKKVLILSLELPIDVYWEYFETRYMFDEKQLNVSLGDIKHHTLNPNLAESVKSFEGDLRDDVVNNLLIIDEITLTKKMLLDYRKFNKLLKAAEKKLGGLDMVVLDHVGQLERLWPDCGNSMLKHLTTSAKTFLNEKGEHISMVWAVQTNREGVRRADRKDGQYDLQAIGDLNEVERSSAYCVFIYTPDGMKITQRTKISLLKNRFGSPIPVPIVTSFTPAVVAVGKEFEGVQLETSDFNFTQGNDGFDDLPDEDIAPF